MPQSFVEKPGFTILTIVIGNSLNSFLVWCAVDTASGNFSVRPVFLSLEKKMLITSRVINVTRSLNPEWKIEASPYVNVSYRPVSNLLLKLCFQELMILRRLQGQHVKLLK